MLQETKIFFLGHGYGMNVKEMAKGWRDFSQEKNVDPKFLAPNKTVADSFSTDGKAAYKTAVGQRNMYAARLAQLRKGKYKQDESQPGDNPHNLTVGNINKLSGNRLTWPVVHRFLTTFWHTNKIGFYYHYFLVSYKTQGIGMGSEVKAKLL